MLWHGDRPAGICVFAAPAAAITLRSRYFGLHHPLGETALSAMNEQLWVLARVVLDPVYRGAGIASAFVRRACESCPVPWIEALAAMGQANPFFERAGFVRVGVIRKTGRGRRDDRYRFSEPVYYVFDNRHPASGGRESPDSEGEQGTSVP